MKKLRVPLMLLCGAVALASCTISSESASNVSTVSAVVTGVVNADNGGPGGDMTSVTVCYSTAGDLNNCASATGTVLTTPATPFNVDGDTDTPVSATLTGLTPGTTYYYQFEETDLARVQSNPSQATDYGTVESFTTLPSDIGMVYVARSGSTLNATWNPAPGATSYTCTLMFGFASPSTFSQSVATPSCTFYGLGTSVYGVSVVANYVGGTSAASVGFAYAAPTTTSTTSTTTSVPAPPAKKTIVCRKGTSVKRVTALNPRCPAGYTKIH